MAETRRAFRSRLEQEGRYREFIQVRESMKREGNSPQEAWKAAMAVFPPLAEGEVAPRVVGRSASGSGAVVMRKEPLPGSAGDPIWDELADGARGREAVICRMVFH